MAATQLEELNQKTTLTEVMQELSKRLDHQKSADLLMFYRSFRMTQSFLPKIYMRILEDAKLDCDYWRIFAELNDPGLERPATAEELIIIRQYKEKQGLLNLDMEDWFLHAHILMEKFAKLSRELLIVTSSNAISERKAQHTPFGGFHDHLTFFLQPKPNIDDAEYCKIIREANTWYIQDIKDVRDDMIQHEIVAKFWGYSTSPGAVRISRFRYSERDKEILYSLRNKYSEIWSYPLFKILASYVEILSFLEKNIGKMETEDADRLRHIRKKSGRQFPDIPRLYSKMNTFFALVNDHFLTILPASV